MTIVDAVTWFSEEEFSGIKWLSLAQVLDEPIETLDPHLHRFTAKLVDTLERRMPSAPGTDS
ncbi:hypothetical protein [Glycomyces albidus]|uniref:Uncharacterized protein n=1 Tax=Glycomyces albidus TaxID=2656774 RepID=A0A6L5G3W1_9ACTN|nr:hypothetical protein [Glycomyces albidus]MQM23978.1 hypothetical protein [Glycomyces albidus]